MRYFEIEFDNEPRNQNGTEGDVSGQYSICILGLSEPTIEEATQFCKDDMELTGYKYVVNVREVNPDEAHKFFDMEHEDDFPIFARGTDFMRVIR